MHFKLSRASSYFASSIRHPASILSFILNLHTGDLQCEDIVLGSDLDSVRHCIADGLVVFHPCCSQSRQFHFSSARKDGIFSSWKKEEMRRWEFQEFTWFLRLLDLRSQSWPWTCLVKARGKTKAMMFQSFVVPRSSAKKKYFIIFMSFFWFLRA